MPKTIITALLTLALTCGCLKQVGQPDNNTLPDSVQTIVVLPVVAAAETDRDGASPKVAKEIQTGIEEFSQILSDYFQGNPKVQLLSPEEVDSHATSYNASRSAQALAIAKSLKAEAVMLWGLQRYHQRGGGDYAVQSPASVAFDYRLIHTASGQTLCAGTFDETQQSVSDNLLSLRSLANRGFKWIPAVDLAREGVAKKIPECRYLQ